MVNCPMTAPEFELRLAQSDADLIAAQRLRYDVFVRELGGDGPLVDHENGLERDAFDPFYDHLILFDHAREEFPCGWGLSLAAGRETEHARRARPFLLRGRVWT